VKGGEDIVVNIEEKEARCVRVRVVSVWYVLWFV